MVRRMREHGFRTEQLARIHRGQAADQFEKITDLPALYPHDFDRLQTAVEALAP